MKPRVATAWLGGCSGCHMSFLDLDERLIELGEKIDLVYSPIADMKVFPANVDVTLVEGAVANGEHFVDDQHFRVEIDRHGKRQTQVHAGGIGSQWLFNELLHLGEIDDTVVQLLGASSFKSQQ